MSTLSSRLLIESWALVNHQSEQLASHFYARLFLSDPGLRELFPAHLEIHRSRLLGAIVTAIVTSAQENQDPDRLAAYLHGLGRDHRKFRVGPAHYSVVGSALIEALRLVGADRWTEAYDQAWREAYELIVTPMLAATHADHTEPPFWPAEVVRHERRGPNIAVFTCRPLLPYPFRAGQYASIESPYQPRLWRTYSIANAPRKDGTLEFHVRAVDSGWASSALVRQLKAGDLVRLAAPMGSMALDRQSTRDIVCVAGGTGLAPFKSFIDELARHNQDRWMHVFVGARTREDLYDLAALNRSAARYPWLSVVPACSDDPTYPGDQGMIGDVVANYGPWTEHDFYVSGSPTMVRPTLDTVAQLGVPASRVHYHAFSDVPMLALARI